VRRWRILFAATTLYGLGGCASIPVFVSKDIGPLHKVAVLPMSNETNDLDGPIYVRRLIQEGLAERGADLVPLDVVDAKLKENGFTDGGQLRAAAPADIGQWVGADTLFYCSLIDFSYVNVGFYWQRKVMVGGRVLDAKTGEKLWETQRQWATRWIVTDKEKAKREFVVQLAIKAAEKMAHTPLAPESHRAVQELLNTIPRR
jgi:hypothetical protein